MRKKNEINDFIIKSDFKDEHSKVGRVTMTIIAVGNGNIQEFSIEHSNILSKNLQFKKMRGE